MKDALGNVQSILVLGGASDLGVAIAGRLARPRQASVVLAGRRPEALDAAAASLRLAGAGPVTTAPFDADDTDSHAAFVETVSNQVGDLDVVIVAFGILGDQAADEAGGDGAVRLGQTNYIGAMSIGLAISRRLKEQGHGTLVFLSSVAGERARRSNFIYGSSKAGIDAFAQGLGYALAGTGAGVLIIRPGFVPTKMTAGRKPAPLASTPDAVAAAAAAGLARGKEIVWVPAGLRWVSSVFRHLPSPVVRRLPW
jgi:decaprenylphospho-beta-D-erythro-pentofuranosid-2-ulose 2-reductase